jgi:hypothetical protein
MKTLLILAALTAQQQFRQDGLHELRSVQLCGLDGMWWLPKKAGKCDPRDTDSSTEYWNAAPVGKREGGKE